MLPHQELVVQEKAELDEKRAKLAKFLSGAASKDVDPRERVRLRSQLIAMHTYSDILGERIAAFSPDMPVVPFDESGIYG